MPNIVVTDVVPPSIVKAIEGRLDDPDVVIAPATIVLLLWRWKIPKLNTSSEV